MGHRLRVKLRGYLFGIDGTKGEQRVTRVTVCVCVCLCKERKEVGKELSYLLFGTSL